MSDKSNHLLPLFIDATVYRYASLIYSFLRADRSPSLISSQQELQLKMRFSSSAHLQSLNSNKTSLIIFQSQYHYQ